MDSRFKKALAFYGLILAVTAIVLVSSSDWPRITLQRQQGVVAAEEARSTGRDSPTSRTVARDFSQAFEAVSGEVLPSVVSIATTRVVQTAQQEEMLPPFLRDFFGRDFNVPEEQRLRALGSGVIVSADGYIMTNNHVIENAEDITVTLYDHRQFQAELIGTDPLTEIAVVKIDQQDLPAAALGSSEQLQIGEWVLAFGNPLYLTSTVTAGIISAKGRAIGIIRDESATQSGGSYAIENFIQTDAAINQGNSGGPLVNLDGEVVGINTAIASRTGTYEGYGFAVPIDLAKKIMHDLIQQGHVTRAWLGISMRAVNERIAERYGMKRPYGALIQQVMEDSPAQKADLRPLDIILSVDGVEIERTNELQNMIALKDPGDVINLEILRDGRKMQKKVTLEQRESVPELETAREENISNLGLTVENLTPAIHSQLGHDYYEAGNGVVVTNVAPYGAAYDAGIRAGDFITAIEDYDVGSVSDYKNALKHFSEGDVVIFTVQRQENEWHAFVKLPQG
jgi:serine protease Do